MPYTDELYDHCLKYAAKRFRVCPDDAPDAAHTAMLAVIQANGSCKNPYAYAEATIRYERNGKWSRRHLHERVLDFRDEVGFQKVVQPDPAFERVETEETLDKLRDALPSLSPRQAYLIERVYFSEEEPEAVRKEMGITDGQYRNLRHHAILKLREAL